jgi:DNA-binding MarR family transcriptional regulator
MATAPTQPACAADDLSDRELHAWRGMLRAHAALKKGLDADLEAEHGIPLSSYEVLLHLSAAEGRRMRMSDLADSIVLSRSGLTRLVDRM